MTLGDFYIVIMKKKYDIIHFPLIPLAEHFPDRQWNSQAGRLRVGLCSKQVAERRAQQVLFLLKWIISNDHKPGYV